MTKEEFAKEWGTFKTDGAGSTKELNEDFRRDLENMVNTECEAARERTICDMSKDFKGMAAEFNRVAHDSGYGKKYRKLFLSLSDTFEELSERAEKL